MATETAIGKPLADDGGRSIARPPTTGERIADLTFRGLTLLFACLTLLVVLYQAFEVGKAAWPAVEKYGFSFLTSSKWDGKDHFGIRPEIWGTLYSSVLGVAIGSVFGLAVAIFLSQRFLPPWLEVFGKNVVELLAAIPSVVYGLWGIFVLIPTIRPALNWLHEHFGWVPFFSTPVIGPGLLPAALVLAIMVLPTISALSRDALIAVPARWRDAAIGLGATRWETILRVAIPTSARGIYGSIVLAFGRALGETMALAMLVGSVSVVSWSVLSPANTLAAMLANRFPEASNLEIGLLMYAALVLMALTLAVNMLGAWIIRRVSVQWKGKH